MQSVMKYQYEVILLFSVRAGYGEEIFSDQTHSCVLACVGVVEQLAKRAVTH